MANSSSSEPGGNTGDVLTGEYASALFDRFVEAVHPEDGELLDLGPTTSANIVFWAERGFRVAAIDLMARRDGLAELELGDRRFAGALCWNAFCGLSRDEAGLLAAKLRRALCPGGYIFAIFDGDGRRDPPALRYRIGARGRLTFGPLERPVEVRAIATSEIEALFGGFRPTKMTVMRHGSREALTHLPGLPRSQAAAQGAPGE